MSESNDAYSQAATSGKYDRGQAYYSKYDNVRLFWEDALTRKYIKPSVAARLETCKAKGRGLRILDMGCGSGDGFELYMQIPADVSDLRSDTNRLIEYDDIEAYMGVDLNEELLKQNSERWGNDPKMAFHRADLSKGLPDVRDEKPYDIYSTTYGTLSHLKREQTIQLLCDIVQHGENGAVVVCDWLGRFSYEWQDLWNDDTSGEQWMDYYISYIYPPEKRKEVELSLLKLRLVTKEEITQHVLGPVRDRAGDGLELKGFYDRSIFIGRHIDTGDYNPHARPLRQYVNSLFERSLRTPLKALLTPYHPHEKIRAENEFFQRAFDAWNYVVSQCAAVCYDEPVAPEFEEIDPPTVAIDTVSRFRDLANQLDRFCTDDIRADILEVQLAFLLRELEAAFQQGHGNGHGLIGVFEIRK